VCVTKCLWLLGFVVYLGFLMENDIAIELEVDVILQISNYFLREVKANN